MWEWLAGIASVITLGLMATKWRWAPMIGLTLQFAWWIFIFVDEVWGLLSCTIAYTIILAVASYTWLKRPKDKI